MANISLDVHTFIAHQSSHDYTFLSLSVSSITFDPNSPDNKLEDFEGFLLFSNNASSSRELGLKENMWYL